ncbi:MAG: ABC transporter permease [Candidatus Calescibacterium sp.]|nr:ABC transporter permease [Candidatus Calescibacterium sp.]MCX7734204.1 ABC transporter permease [bacterium]MDW8086534.1 ABC transporter permease [Candidatus Calescibacterium sp.]
MILNFLKYNFEFLLAFTRKIFFRETILASADFIRSSLPPTLGVCIPFAVITAFHGWKAAEIFGAYRFLPTATNLVMLREVAPVISTLIMIAVLGNAISSQIALMKLRGEFTYLETIGVNPYDFVAFPRIIATVFCNSVLFILVSASSLAGLFVYMVKIKGMEEGIFLDGLWTIVEIRDLLGGLLKSAVFGFITGQIATFFGFVAEESTEGVGKASARTVLISSISFIIVNVILSIILFGEVSYELR